MYQHGYSLRSGDRNSALHEHREENDHIIDMNSAKLLVSCHNSDNKKILESFIIKKTNNFNRNPGEIKIDDTLNNLLKMNRIVIFKKNSFKKYLKKKYIYDLLSNQPKISL